MGKNQKIKNRTIGVLIQIVLLAISWAWPSAVLANNYDVQVATTVDVSGTAPATVTHTISTQGLSTKPLNKELTFVVAGLNIRGIVATEQDGTPMNTVINQASGNQIVVTLPDTRLQSDADWSFSLRYSTDLLEQFGSMQALQFPGFSSNFMVTAHTVVLSADLGLGPALVKGPQPSATRVGIGKQIIEYSNQSGEVSDTFIITFSETAYAELAFTATLKNNSWWWRNMIVTLPPDTNQQRVVLDSIEPKPSKIQLDKDGNIIAIYRIGPLGQRNVSAKAYVSVKGTTYKMADAKPNNSLGTDIATNYTKITDIWQPLGLDVQFTSEESVDVKVKTIFDAVVDRAKEDQAPKTDKLSVTERNSSLKYADWLVGELRSRGIPSRIVLGLSMSDGSRLLDARQHAWAEAYIAGVGWVTLDPWLATFGNNFGVSDPLRIGLAVWGIEDSKPPVDLGITTVSFINELPQFDEQTASLKLTKYVLLPFVSVMVFDSSIGAGGIVDNLQIQSDKGDIALGSQAPLQSWTVRSLRFGMEAFSSETANIGINDGTFSAWGEATSSRLSYLPLAVVAGIIVTVGLIWVIRRRGGGQRRRKPSKESLMLHDEALGGEIEIEDLITRNRFSKSPTPTGEQSESLPDHDIPATPPNQRSPESQPPPIVRRVQ